MKNITELTEQEINELTDDQIYEMIKYRKAEEGVKFLDAPIEPKYNDITKPDIEVYTIGLFEKSGIWFTDMNEAISLIDTVKKIQSLGRLDYDYNITDSDTKFFTTKLKEYSSDKDSTDLITKTVYSKDLYMEISGSVKENKKLKEVYEKSSKEYSGMMKDAEWISKEIWDRVHEVRNKFWKMENYYSKFKSEYLPLSGNNYDIALGFLDKAYSLNNEEKLFIETQWQSK